jgi:DNA-binding transcriptional ArsR family regulator
MPNQIAALDRVFHALSDPTRRAVLQRLGAGPAAVSELAEPFAMALPSFMQHLRVLEDGHLVHSRKRGRVRTYELAPKTLEAAGDWISRQRELWGKRLDQLDAFLAQAQKKKP